MDAADAEFEPTIRRLHQQNVDKRSGGGISGKERCTYILTSRCCDAILLDMRTTLSLDDDILSAAKVLAAEQGKSIGAVVSDLARRALRPDVPMRGQSGIPTFSVSRDAPVLTSEMVRAARDD